MGMLSSVTRWFGFGGALGETVGPQYAGAFPIDAGDAERVSATADRALQVSTVWLCVDRRASTVASLPLMVYRRMRDGQKELARDHALWRLLHDSPNARMTPFDFWRVMLLNYDLRGNAYARIDRNPAGDAVSLWPMPADQVEPTVLDDGSMVYAYRIGTNVAILAEENVLHLRNLGNGTIGLDKMAFMSASMSEAIKQQQSATRVWSSSGKPTGVLMLDHVLKPEQRKSLLERFGEMAQGNRSRLYLLEANMKYQQISITPEQQQLLDSRRFSIEDICRWYDMPPVLAHHNNVTTWGSAVAEIVDGWLKLSLRPLLVSIEQAVQKRVLTARERAVHQVEWSVDALLRANAKDRAEIYSSGVNNGWMTRNEARQLENLPRMDGGDDLTAQINLAPLQRLGGMGATNAAA